METISSRVKIVVENEIQEFRRAAALFEKSGIAAESWKKFLAGKQNASHEMIQYVCQEWPENAFWIATGITDSSHGHIAPDIAYKNNVNRKRSPRIFSKPYFKWKIAVLKGQTTNVDWEDLLAEIPGQSTRERINESNSSWGFEAEYLEWKHATEEQRERIDLENFRKSDEGMSAARDTFLRYANPIEENELRKKFLSSQIKQQRQNNSD
ncbi:hypothetical protein ACO0K9_26790 [Undibacterium sp. Ji50W]|uniref:hypothetical protein n=1 Tax=Undibacterium sp. Ji50W TaxID=3413041 RepID=UPI003BF3604B